ncbi:MAG: ketoacyl-ACP synthase III [Bryobacteraceae bacterium]
MAFLRAFGAYLPDRVVPNAEFAARLGVEDSWIVQMSGIEERRFAADSETVVDMGVRAAEACLARAGLAAESVGLIVVSSGTGERRFPGPASEIGMRLGISGIPAIDVPVASAGSIFGLTLAHQLASHYGEVLVIAAEKMSSVVWNDNPDKNTAILFGDGAGAALVSSKSGAWEVRATALHSDGSTANDLSLPVDGPLRMNGMVVIRHASQKLPSVIKEVLAAGAVLAADVGAILMHQANQNLMNKVASTVGVAAERLFTNVARYGNTSSASMLIAAAEWQDAGGASERLPIVFAGFGAGFHWGALLAVPALQ